MSEEFLNSEEEDRLAAGYRNAAVSNQVSRLHRQAPHGLLGWRYGFNGGGLSGPRTCPEFLTGLRAHAETFAGSGPGSLQQVLVTEYSPGAGIGWHKDRSVFGKVVGISLLSPCSFRLRRRTLDSFERRTLIVAPR